VCDRRQEPLSGRASLTALQAHPCFPGDQPACTQRCNGRNNELGKTLLLRTW